MFFNYVKKRFFSINCNRLTQCSIANIIYHKQYDKIFDIVCWLKSRRRFKDINFLHVDDGSTHQRLQIVVPKSICPNELKYHSCLRIKGKLQESIGSKQEMEILAENITVVSPGAPVEFPFVEKATYLKEDLRCVPEYRSRTPEFAATLRVRSQVKKSLRKFFESNGYVNVDTPILTQNNCEGAGEIFSVKGHSEVKYHDNAVAVGDGTFGKPVFLSVSGQLHLEAMTSGMSRVYNFNPAFRADPGSRNHLQEFWMLEAEKAFLMGRDGYQDLIDTIEGLVKFAVQNVLDSSSNDIGFLLKNNKKEHILEEILPKIINTPFVKLKFEEAKKIILNNQDRQPSSSSGEEQEHSKGLSRRNELFLTEYFGRVPVLVTDWPTDLMPFYTYVENTEYGNIALGVDLLMPYVGEVVGGGLREYRYGALEKRLKRIKSEASLKWYLDLRKWGYAPSGGFGLGFERFLQFLLGIDNIKDTIPFPRSAGQCRC